MVILLHPQRKVGIVSEKKTQMKGGEKKKTAKAVRQDLYLVYYGELTTQHNHRATTHYFCRGYGFHRQKPNLHNSNEFQHFPDEVAYVCRLADKAAAGTKSFFAKSSTTDLSEAFQLHFQARKGFHSEFWLKFIGTPFSALF